MGERKVINKYYPSDFDPSMLNKKKNNNNKYFSNNGGRRQAVAVVVVRMMLPFTIRCNHCGDYISRGRKFNSRKENVVGQSYLGVIQLFRFNFNCPNCFAEISIKTDPKNSGYLVEFGARTTTFNSFDLREETKDDDDDDAMNGLESKRLELKREMKINESIGELQSLKSRHECVSAIDCLLFLKEKEKEKEKAEIIDRKLKEEEEAALKSIVFHRQVTAEAVTKQRNCCFMMMKKRKRTTDQEEEEEEATNTTVRHRQTQIKTRSAPKFILKAKTNQSALQLLSQEYGYSEQD